MQIISLIKNQYFKFINFNINEPLNTKEHLNKIYNLAYLTSSPYQQKGQISTKNNCFYVISNILVLEIKIGNIFRTNLSDSLDKLVLNAVIMKGK